MQEKKKLTIENSHHIIINGIVYSLKNVGFIAVNKDGDAKSNHVLDGVYIRAQDILCFIQQNMTGLGIDLSENNLSLH